MRSRAIEQYKRTLTLSSIHHEVLVGTLLGDSCLETQNEGRTYRLKFEQSVAHAPYAWHMYSLFRQWVLTPPRERVSRSRNGTYSRNVVFQTVSHAAFSQYARQYYAERKKKVPELIGEWLTPRGLAYWFMDDGSVKSAQSKGVILNTQAFTLDDVERLIDVLRRTFGLQASIRPQSDGYQIYVSGRSHEDFSKLIEPYMIQEMRYKVPLARRTHLPKR